MRFTTEPLHAIVRRLERELESVRASGDVLEFTVVDPDLGRGLYGGERVEVAGRPYTYRPYRSWLDLAERLGCRFLTPRPEGEGLVALRFAPSGEAATSSGEEGAVTERAATERAAPERAVTEKYGAASAFARLRKLEEPTFLLDLSDALLRLGLEPGSAVLDLGVNSGDEFALFPLLYPPEVYSSLRFTGVDHSASALRRARERFPGGAFTFLEADLGRLGELGLGAFDLALSVGTLQSPGVDSRELLRRLVQHHLKPACGLVLGFPNCRYRGGELVYGARMKNYREPDLSLLVKDLAFYRRYLQQHRFRVFVTGKYYLFLTALRS